MLWLALPVLAEQLLTMLVGYTDWWLVGHYLDGPAPKAAMGLMAYVLWLIPSLFSAVAIGATALVARFVGAGDLPAGPPRSAQITCRWASQGRKTPRGTSQFHSF